MFENPLTDTLVTKILSLLAPSAIRRREMEARLASLQDQTQQKIPETRSLVWVPFMPGVDCCWESMALSEP